MVSQKFAETADDTFLGCLKKLVSVCIGVCITGAFLQRDAMHKRGICRHAVSVCLSVCHVREFCQNE